MPNLSPFVLILGTVLLVAMFSDNLSTLFDDITPLLLGVGWFYLVIKAIPPML